MRMIQLDHCVIGVSDWKTSNAFYRDVVGAEIVEGGSGRVAYRLGDTQLNVHEGTSVYFRDPDGSLLEFIAYT